MNRKEPMDFVEDMRVISTLFSFLLESFRFIEKERRYDEDFFGNFVLRWSGDFDIRFIRDRGYITVDVCPKGQSEGWFDLRDIIAFVTNKNSTDLSGLTTEQIAVLLQKNYDDIKSALNNEESLRYFKDNLSRF
jgi:hypothetical protein